MVAPPVLFVVKFTAAVAPALQTTWSAGSLTCPAGLTITSLVIGLPRQAVAPGPLGVIVYVTVTGDVPLCARFCAIDVFSPFILVPAAGAFPPCHTTAGEFDTVQRKSLFATSA